jgi:hypothetical protein
MAWFPQDIFWAATVQRMRLLTSFTCMFKMLILQLREGPFQGMELFLQLLKMVAQNTLYINLKLIADGHTKSMYKMVVRFKMDGKI